MILLHPFVLDKQIVVFSLNYDTYDIHLNGAVSYTVFLPNDPAVDAITDDFGDPEISQFDMLGFIDLPAALRYSIVEGVYMAEDLLDGQLLLSRMRVH